MDSKSIEKKQSVSLPQNYDFKDGQVEIAGVDTDSALKLQAIKTYNFDKQLNAFDYYLKTPVEVNKLRDFDKEFNILVPEPSWIGGRSINPYAENNSAVQRMVDISASLVWNPNSADNLVMKDLPKGGSSTRF